MLKKSTIFLFCIGMILCMIGCGALSSTNLTIVSGSENKTLEPIIQEFKKKTGISIDMVYKGSIDIMLELSSGDVSYDAVWPANGLWLSLGDKNRKIKHTESIMTSPVVFGIRKSLAEDLGLTGKDVMVKDILEVILEGKLQFMMTSATQSNSGASAYLGFLYALLGSSDVITLDDLEKQGLKVDIRNLFSGINRSSGSSGWLKELFLESDYDAMVNYEAIIIEINQELVKQGKEPLYVVYPVDGIVMADSPLGFVDQGDEVKEGAFKRFQEYLLSHEVQNTISGLGRRTGFGGFASDVDTGIFNPDWGIDPNKMLSPIMLPDAKVISRALELYQTEFRKPSFTVFCLDYSGSMGGNGEYQLKDAMDVLLDQEKASDIMLQAGEDDITIILPFSSEVIDVWQIKGNDPKEMLALSAKIRKMKPDGEADIYSPVIRGLEIMKKYQNLNDYVPAIILMTDGESNPGNSISELRGVVKKNGLDVPVFGILFGEAIEEQLREITDLTKGRVFDGKHDLIQTFRKAKGYN